MNADDIRNAIAAGKEITGHVGGRIVKITRVVNDRSVMYIGRGGGVGVIFCGECDIADIHGLEATPCNARNIDAEEVGDA